MQKKKNILYTLRERELNSFPSPLVASLKILKELVKSEDTSYSKTWDFQRSTRPIIYDNGFLIAEQYTKFYKMCGHKGVPSLAFNLPSETIPSKILEAITYSYPIIGQTPCDSKRKIRDYVSQFIILLTADSWMEARNLENGKQMWKVYTRCPTERLSFKFCNWNTYGETFTLTTISNLCKEQDVVRCLAVFSIFPLKFQALLEFKKSVFGRTCQHINVSDNLLIIGMGYDRVHIFSFSELLAESKCKSYIPGQEYEGLGVIGCYPTPLPVNGIINSAPPLLLNVQCSHQTLIFGGYPYSYIYAAAGNPQAYYVQPIREEESTSAMTMQTNVTSESELVQFHPNLSNHILIRDNSLVKCYKMNNQPPMHLDLAYTIGFPIPERRQPPISMYGRRIKPIFHTIASDGFRTVLAMDHEDELGFIAVLGFDPEDIECSGKVKLFDEASGMEIKCINLKLNLSEFNGYEVMIDRAVILILERDNEHRNQFHAYVYQLCHP